MLCPPADMQDLDGADDWRLEDYRSYLYVLARMQVPRKVRSKFDCSDIVQDTLARAHERRKQFRGRSEAELKGWLRTILANSLANALESLGARKRDVGLERSLEIALAGTSTRLERWIVADLVSPSEGLIRQQQLDRLIESLHRLPVDQRQAVELRYLEELRVDDICARMGRSPASVAGLLRRAIKSLRDVLSCDPAKRS